MATLFKYLQIIFFLLTFDMLLGLLGFTSLPETYGQLFKATSYFSFRSSSSFAWACYFSYAFFSMIISQVYYLYLSIHFQFIYPRNCEAVSTLTSLLWVFTCWRKNNLKRIITFYFGLIIFIQSSIFYTKHRGYQNKFGEETVWNYEYWECFMHSKILLSAKMSLVMSITFLTLLRNWK